MRKFGSHFFAKGSKSVAALFAMCVCLSADAFAFDITSFNTLQTASPSTIEQVEVEHPRFVIRDVVIQSYGGLEQPTITFTVKNKSAVTISKIYLTGVLKDAGRSVPLASQDFDLSVPGGIQPGEQKHFNLDASSYGDWGNVTKLALRNARFILTLTAVDDAKGVKIVR
ncbi:hypothetical protein [Methylocystis bryophila]|uniref:Late embryogenesis abundant protein LEA-2 subgroup domain-containing protein n=1 Tax=Methylocystis bryophila TaxID=655015 RepID=A0A1W6MQE2_9HYPH|nr:hypothetical protein [Methylocystis bryophila]ARN79821.1 hypothetical protein B1812_00650 [Methylocystis bryophila]BDV39705.1 hypothetical protein DSM21852_29580 [Methylocystis bryophila]